jgi:putative phosphoribosyl transferase
VIHFKDRSDAGRLLALELRNKKATFDLVIGLARGGVEVASEISRAFQVPLDVLIVKKLGAPFQPELAIGAIASGGYAYINYELCRGLSLNQSDVTQIRYQATKTLIERERKILGNSQRYEWKDKNILLVDDGLATGATMEVAIRAAKARRPLTVSIAAPVAAMAIVRNFENRVNKSYFLITPQHLGAVGEFYENFYQVTDYEVNLILKKSVAGEVKGEAESVIRI